MAENLGDLLPDWSPEACAARLKERAAPFADFITFDEKQLMFDLVWPCRDPYSIPLNEISSPKELVKWLAHLSEKPWVTPMHIAGLVTLVDIHVGLYALYNQKEE